MLLWGIKSFKRVCQMTLAVINLFQITITINQKLINASDRWSELLVIVVLAVLIIGPKDMPVVIKKIASSVKKKNLIFKY